MNLSIRVKILLSFLLLVVMLIAAGSLAIYEFRNLSHSVNEIIENNYKTIVAAEDMRDALEREDSGILLLLLGNYEDGRRNINKADSTFLEALEIAAKNITEDGEAAIIERIAVGYHLFCEKWERPIVDTNREGNLIWYTNEVHPYFLQVKSDLEKLLAINQESMYVIVGAMHDKARRAIMPGIVAIGGSLVFLLLLNYFIKSFLVMPVITLLEKIRNMRAGTNPIRDTPRSRDEIANIESEISRLIDRT